LRRPPKLSRLFLIAIPFLYLGLGSGRCAASPKVDKLFLFPGFINSGFTIGDFDGDGLLDDVVLVRATPISPTLAVYNISIHMGSGVTQEVSITGPLGVFEILQRDVTGNGTPDLVLAAPWQDHPLAVLVNKDNGMGTFRIADPVVYAAANEIRSVANLTSQSAPHLDSVALSAKRIVPRENEGHDRFSLPRPPLASPFAPEKGDAGRLLLFSLSGRAPPSFQSAS
jgi:hypothetical protein